MLRQPTWIVLLFFGSVCWSSITNRDSVAMKKCNICNTEKPFAMFGTRKDTRDGYASRCNPCAAARVKAWRAANPERSKEIHKKHHAKHRGKRAAACREAYWRDPEPYKARQRQRQAALKDEAYQAYGGYVCVCCGETERAFLTLDHINNDGNKHRKEVDPAAMYYWLKKHGYPSIVQVLCASCNQGKKINGGVCPHVSKRRAAEWCYVI
jgi:hypothetical protein